MRKRRKRPTDDVLILPDDLLRRTIPGNGGCLLWTGSHNSSGSPYIALRANGYKRDYTVRKLLWEYYEGREVPSRKPVVTSCYDQSCIAREHMIVRWNDRPGQAEPRKLGTKRKCLTCGKTFRRDPARALFVCEPCQRNNSYQSGGLA